jgi:hypothetical protein
VLGCSVSYVWLMAGIRQLWNLRHLVDSMSDSQIMGNEAANLIANLFQARWNFQSPRIRWTRAVPGFCIVLPLAVFVAWFFVTITYTEHGGSWVAFVSILVVIVMLTCLWVYISSSHKPIIPSEAVTSLRPRNPSQR